MDLSLQKRLAAEILGVGVSRVKIKPEEAERVSEALTREDVKKLIKEGIIYVEPVHGNAHRWLERRRKRQKGHRRGCGKRKGKKTARLPEKEAWMHRIRKMRRHLRYLRDNKRIDARTYRRLYMLAKGGMFKSLSALQSYITEHSLLKKK